jgi:hypothetical protein
MDYHFHVGLTIYSREQLAKGEPEDCSNFLKGTV